MRHSVGQVIAHALSVTTEYATPSGFHEPEESAVHEMTNGDNSFFWLLDTPPA